MNVVGIDGGLDGAFVMLAGDQVIHGITPTIGKGRRQYDMLDMCGLFRHLQSRGPLHAFLELSHAMPKNGTQAAFSQGTGNGAWQMLLTALAIPFEIVSPPRWQNAMFIGVTGDDTKAKSETVAKRLRPDIDWRKSERCKNVHDGKTDAFCIAEWGRRQMALRSGSAA